MDIPINAKVSCTDGPCGHSTHVVLMPASEKITHLVMREGHLWGQKDVSIPVAQIDHYKDDIVYLKLDKRAIAALPAIPIHRGVTKE